MERVELEDQIDVARGLKPCDMVLSQARWLDVFSGELRTGDVAIYNGKIVGVGEKYSGRVVRPFRNRVLVPGFIDSHVHIESSLMIPSEFERAVLRRGTTAAIIDPHEIANVLGEKGLEFILAAAEKATMDFFVMLSSCVPATHLETSGGTLTRQSLLKYKNHPKVLGLAEMMNYPGVLNKQTDVLDKILSFQDVPMDGHAPMLRGKDLSAYISCGIKTCHESVSLAEAQEKLSKGMQVLLREGSVAKNLDDLVEVLNEYSSPQVSFCTDDRNPLDILDEGHLDFLIRKSIKSGVAPNVAYRSASYSTALRYGLKNKGAIAPGFDADIVVLKDFKKCQVEKVIKAGKFVEDKPRTVTSIPYSNSIRYELPPSESLEVLASGTTAEVHVIEVLENSIVTKKRQAKLPVVNGVVLNDIKNDIAKIVVLERHGQGIAPAKSFVKGMHLKAGAIGSSVGHDSHNAVAIGVNDQDILKCFVRLKEIGGGFLVVKDNKVLAELPLPIAGLMTTESLENIYMKLKTLKSAAKKLGCQLSDPFLQMAFLCLPVIPEIKITDKGLVDVLRFEFLETVITESSAQL